MLFIVAFMYCGTCVLQAQQKNYINYQGVARNSDNDLMDEEAIEIGIALKFGSSEGVAVYQESHSITTDANGVFNIQIGNGSVSSGDYSRLPWGEATFVAVSFNDIEVGTTELMAVPYAMASGNQQWLANGNDIENKNTGEVKINSDFRVVGGFNLNSGNQVDEISDDGDLLENSTRILPTQRAVKAYVDNRLISGGDAQIASEVPYDNMDSGLTAGNVQEALDELVGSGGGGADADVDPTNEIQDISLSGTDLSITDGSTIDLSAIIPPGGTDDQNASEVPFDNSGTSLAAVDTQSAIEELASGGLVDTDEQNLSLSGTMLQITDGTGVDLSAIIPPGGTDDQNASEVPFDNAGTSLAAVDTQAAIEELASGGLVDTDDQGLVLTGDILSIEDGSGSVDLGDYVDITMRHGLLVGDDGVVDGLVGTVDGQVAKWDAGLGNWVAGTDEVGVDGGGTLWSEAFDGINYDAGNVTIGALLPGHIPNASQYLTVSGGVSDGDFGAIEIKGRQNIDNRPIGRFGFLSMSSFGPTFEIARIEARVSDGAQFYGDLAFYTMNGTSGADAVLEEQMTIKRTGNVGIGTTSPTTKLDVEGGIRSSDLFGTGQRNIVADADGNLMIGSGSGGSSLWTEIGDNIHFDLGSVGIGNGNPGVEPGASKYLTVATGTSPADNSFASIEIQGGQGSTNSPIGRLDFISNSSPGNSAISRIETRTADGAQFRGNIAFYTKDGANYGESMLFERLTIKHDGNVGIGTINPSEKLEVNGDIKTTGEIHSNSTGMANMIPIAYGSVNSGGYTNSGSGNFSVRQTGFPGWFSIKIFDENYHYATYTTVLTIRSASPGFISSSSGGGELSVRTFNASGLGEDLSFTFVVYKN